jgi:ribosomal protein S18 acetylase RimI-like enzyme
MVVLRDATESDCASIAQLHAESWRSAYRGMLSDEYLDTRAHAERAALWQARFSERAAKPFFAILAEIGAKLAGFACVFPNEHPVFGSYVDNLHVAPQLARKGIGRHLLTAAGRRLIADQTPGGVYLWVIEKNTNARQFYSRVGAVEVGTEEFTMADGGRVTEVRCYWPHPANLLPPNEQPAPKS